MKLWSSLKSTFRNLSYKSRAEDPLEAQLHRYINMLVAERIAAGMSPSEARRTVLAEFKDFEEVGSSVQGKGRRR
jgi:hypothetical protein